MEKYLIMEKLGSGTFGVVWKAFNKRTYETVAIKKLMMKYESPTNKMMIKREVQSLVSNTHENIVKLKEIIKENNVIFLVFEYMEGSLYDLMVHRTCGPFSEPEVRNVCFQIFQGLAYMHRNGYIHRDLKPENVLVSNGVVKIGDLGSSRDVVNDARPYTHNVTTPWYRAPEVFLHSRVYGSAVDMWAMGAIMAELLTFRPLFQGSSDLNVMNRICCVLGAPTERSWPGGVELARSMNYRFPDDRGVRFSQLLPRASPEAVDLIGKLLSWAPYARPTAEEALGHPFFRGCYIEEYSEAALPVFFLDLVEMMKKKANLGRAEEAQEYDPVRMLPEYPFEFMREKKSCGELVAK